MANIFTLFLFLFFLLWIWRRSLKAARQSTLPPEADGVWPMIGHLHLLGWLEPPHITLGNMVEKHGAIFTIRLGIHRAFVVSNWKIAKESFTTNDKAFANWPKGMASELAHGVQLCYVWSAALRSLPATSLICKIITLKVLSNHKLEMFKHIKEFEVNTSINEIYELCVNDKKLMVEMKWWFNNIALNVIFRMVVGEWFACFATKDDENEVNDRCQIVLRDLCVLSGMFVLSDALPYLRWLDLGGYEKAMKKTAKYLDHVLEGWLEEHNQRKLSSEMNMILIQSLNLLAW